MAAPHVRFTARLYPDLLDGSHIGIMKAALLIGTLKHPSPAVGIMLMEFLPCGKSGINSFIRKARGKNPGLFSTQSFLPSMEFSSN
jgi:hypothetical protein